MKIRINPPRSISTEEIELGSLNFPLKWLSAPRNPDQAHVSRRHDIVDAGEKWCTKHLLTPLGKSQYKYDKAVWVAVITETILFDCDTGSILVNFVGDVDDEDFAMVTMSASILLDLQSLVTAHCQSPTNTTAFHDLRNSLLSFCIDLYSSFVLRELRKSSVIPANYYIWLAQLHRRDCAKQVCGRAKEIAEIIYAQTEHRMDPELGDWVRDCIDEPLADSVDYLLSINSRKKSQNTYPDSSMAFSDGHLPSTPDASMDGSSDSHPSSDDSPTPAADISLFDSYRNDFALTKDMLGWLEPKRMAKLCPPRLSRRGLELDTEAVKKIEDLSEDIKNGVNRIRRLEKLIEDEEIKEKDFRARLQPDRDELADDTAPETESEEVYNLRARRAIHITFEAGNSRQQKSDVRGVKKKKKKRYARSDLKIRQVRKTPEEYEEEWKRREDSPYPRRYRDIEIGPSGNIDMKKSNSGPTKMPSSSPRKRKYDSDNSGRSKSVMKRLKTITEEGHQKKERRSSRQANMPAHESDEFDDGDSDKSEEADHGSVYSKPRPTSGRKKLMHLEDILRYENRLIEEEEEETDEEDEDRVCLSTIERLNAFRSHRRSTGIASSQDLSDREIANIERAASSYWNGHSSGNSASSFSSRASSSTSLEVDENKDLEPGWTIKTRPPLSTKPLSTASSRANSAAQAQIGISQPNSTSRPSLSRIQAQRSESRNALQREESNYHPDAFFIGFPAFMRQHLHSEVPEPATPQVGENVYVKDDDEEVTFEEIEYNLSVPGNAERTAEELILDILTPTSSPENMDVHPRPEGEIAIMDERWHEMEQLRSSPDIPADPTMSTAMAEADVAEMRAGAAEELDTIINHKANNKKGSTGLEAPVLLAVPILSQGDPPGDKDKEERSKDESSVNNVLHNEVAAHAATSSAPTGSASENFIAAMPALLVLPRLDPDLDDDKVASQAEKESDETAIQRLKDSIQLEEEETSKEELAQTGTDILPQREAEQDNVSAYAGIRNEDVAAIFKLGESLQSDLHLDQVRSADLSFVHNLLKKCNLFHREKTSLPRGSAHVASILSPSSSSTAPAQQQGADVLCSKAASSMRAGVPPSSALSSSFGKLLPNRTVSQPSALALMASVQQKTPKRAKTKDNPKIISPSRKSFNQTAALTGLPAASVSSDSLINNGETPITASVATPVSRLSLRPSLSTSVMLGQVKVAGEENHVHEDDEIALPPPLSCTTPTQMHNHSTQSKNTSTSPLRPRPVTVVYASKKSARGHERWSSSQLNRRVPSSGGWNIKKSGSFQTVGGDHAKASPKTSSPYKLSKDNVEEGQASPTKQPLGINAFLGGLCYDEAIEESDITAGSPFYASKLAGDEITKVTVATVKTSEIPPKSSSGVHPASPAELENYNVPLTPFRRPTSITSGRDLV